MSEIANAFSLGARLVNSLLTMIAGGFVLVGYGRTKLHRSLYYGSGLITAGISYAFAVGYAVGVIGRTVTAFFIQEKFLSLSITLFYYACVRAMTRRRFYSEFPAWVILILQEAVLVYFYLILNEHFINIFIHVILFGLPVSTLVALFFRLDYLSVRRKSSLLIALSFWFLLAIGPIFLVVDGTPLDWIYHIMNTGNTLLMFTGFIMLARSEEKQLAFRRGTGQPAETQFIGRTIRKRRDCLPRLLGSGYLFGS